METTFGSRLHTLRKNNRWTLAELSKRSGLSISHISSLERGARTKPSMDVVTKLANALQVPFHSLQETDSLHGLSHEGDHILSSYSPEVQQFLLQQDATPYILFAKKLYHHYKNDDTDLSIIESLAEFIRSIQK
jgi:transcriptional regulator with XRE-family HTH domain